MTRRAVVLKESEAQFQRQVIDLAETLGWAVRHNADSRRTQAGEPDLELLRGATMLRWELKTDTGVVKPAQEAYIDRLNLVRFVYASVIRPHDMETIADTLRRAAR
jgi:hypothetical protein